MKAVIPSPLTPILSDPAVYPDYLESLLTSRTLERAPALRALLLYLWQHREDTVSEYAIATQALGRSSLFDAKTDATVRVQISRLRQRLEKYYEEEGAGRPERVQIPLGTHQIRVEAAPRIWAVERLPLLQPAAAPVPRSRSALWYLGGLCVLLLMVCFTLAVALARRPAAAPRNAARQEAAWFWKNFFSNGRDTRIILPTPVFFSFPGPEGHRLASVMLRDTEVNDFAKRMQSPQYRALEKSLGPAQLASNYTVTSDTFASVRLARYLDNSGLGTKVLSSADAPLEALDRENVIALGTWGTLSGLEPYLDRLSYVLGSHETAITVRNPEPDEPRRVDLVTESAERSIWPGVIALLPGRSGQTRLLVLASRHTSALVSFLTSTNGLEQLERLWRGKGSPAYFETIVNAEMNGGTLVRFRPVSLRAYHP